jgi:hypothetical protein
MTLLATHPSRSVGLGPVGRLVDATGDLRLIGLMRAAFGVIVILHFWPDVTADRIPVERFHEPWWSWLPVPGPSTYRLLLWVGVGTGVLMILGWLARIATASAFAIVLYLLVIDLSGFGHNRAFLTWMLFGLALMPTGRSWSLAALRARRRGAALDTTGLTWPVLMLRMIVSGVYLASAGSKLLDPAWRSGLVLWDRTVRFEHTIPGAFDGWIHEMLVSRWFHRILSPAAIATELFVAFALWFPRTRRAGLAVAIVFHVSIEITARVQTFSYSALAALLIWLIPLGLESGEERRDQGGETVRPPSPGPLR